MKKLLTLSALFALSFPAAAQITLTGANPSYTQNFNALDTAVAATNTMLPAGWKIAETGAGGNNQYRGGTGSAINGDTYSFGAAGSTERALGALGSNSLQSHFGAAFINNTGQNISSVSVSVRVEQWRVGDTSSRPDSLLFYYSAIASDVDTGMAGWTEVPALLVLSVQPGGVTGGALNGNTVNATKSGTVQLAAPIQQGSQLRVKWVDKNIVGTDDGLAIDDLTMNFITTPAGIDETASVKTALTVLGRATTDRILVGFTAAKQETFTLTLHDLGGREVARQGVQASAGTNQVLMTPGAIATGQYILRVSNGKSADVVKVVVE